MSAAVVVLLARKEVRDALANRWFLLYAGAFLVLSLALSAVSLSPAAGHAGFGRTAASLINLVLLVVPLMGLTLGAASLAAERESGTLQTLLAQPVLPVEIVAGKYVGLAVALVGALALGFGAAGLTLAAGSAAVDPVGFGAVAGYGALLALAMLSVGLFVSAASSKQASAAGVAMVAWLAFVFLGDFGLMGGAVSMRLPVPTLLGLAVANPTESYRIGAIHSIVGNLDALGPAGNYAVLRFGAGLPWVLTIALLVWAIVAGSAAAFVTNRRGP